MEQVADALRGRDDEHDGPRPERDRGHEPLGDVGRGGVAAPFLPRGELLDNEHGRRATSALRRAAGAALGLVARAGAVRPPDELVRVNRGRERLGRLQVIDDDLCHLVQKLGAVPVVGDRERAGVRDGLAHVYDEELCPRALTDLARLY